jgi:hypothetical protein
MKSLSRQAPRPRRLHSSPSYPRALGLGALALVAAACGGSVDVAGANGAGAGNVVTTSGTTAPPYTTSTNVAGAGGYGGEGAYGGAGGTNWGGGLSGDMPDPYDGGTGAMGGAGGAADSAS